MRLFYIGKAARKYSRARRHDKRHLRTTAGCGVNALSVLQNRLFRQNPARAQKMVLPERFG